MTQASPSIVSITFTVATTFEPRLIAAIRGTYPSITSGLTDGQAARAAVKQWATQLVSNWEATQQVGSQDSFVSAHAQAYQSQYNTTNTDATAAIS